MFKEVIVGVDVILFDRSERFSVSELLSSMALQTTLMK